jgi:hypothetical protein
MQTIGGRTAMNNDPKRLLHAAQALALVYDDKWEALDADAKAHYQKEAVAVVNALAIYDSAKHGRLVRAGHAESRRAGRPSPGRREIESTLAHQVREMLEKKFTSRTIRELTGLGNSTITRIRSEMERDNGVPARPTATERGATSNLQV